MYHRTGQDVLRDVVHHVAPAELEKLDETCRAYIVRPHPPQRLRRPTVDPLGIGFESAVLLPVLVAVVSQVLSDLASERIRASGTQLKRWWRRRRGADTEGRRAALTSAVPELSGVTRQELADWAMAQGRAAGLSASQAETCAQVIVVAVVGGNAGPQSDEAPGAPNGTVPGTRSGPTPTPRHPGGPEPEHRADPEPEHHVDPDPCAAPAGPGDDAGAVLRPERGDASTATDPSSS